MNTTIEISISPNRSMGNGLIHVRMPGELRPKVEADLFRYAKTNKAAYKWTGDDYIDGQWVHNPKRPYQTIEVLSLLYEYDIKDDSFSENICNEIADILISHGINRGQILIEVWFYSDRKYKSYWMEGSHPTVSTINTITIASRPPGHSIYITMPSVIQHQMKNDIQKYIKDVDLKDEWKITEETSYISYAVVPPSTESSAAKKIDFAEQCCKDIGTLCIASGYDPRKILIHITSINPVKRYSPAP